MAEVDELPPAGIAELLPTVAILIGILVVLLYGFGCLGSSSKEAEENASKRKTLLKAGSGSSRRVRDPVFEGEEEEEEEEEDEEDEEDDKVVLPRLTMMLRCCADRVGVASGQIIQSWFSKGSFIRPLWWCRTQLMRDFPLKRF
jgi:hypothetical protein